MGGKKRNKETKIWEEKKERKGQKLIKENGAFRYPCGLWWGPQATVLALTLPGSCWLLVHPLSVQPLGCGVGLPPTGLSG